MLHQHDFKPRGHNRFNRAVDTIADYLAFVGLVFVMAGLIGYGVFFQ